ncbi:MAG TPA: AAA family ATPase [Kofleriaceae bacterium]|nr:AAA family ATPase [Kofleriaceae bacterium]
MTTVELGVIAGYARALVERLIAREAGRRGDPQASRFSVSAGEVVKLLRGDVPDGDTSAADQRLRDAWTAIHAHCLAFPEGPLARAARVLELSDLDLQLLCAAAGPDIDPSLERSYAFAWDDFTRKRPDVGFLVRLVAAPPRVIDPIGAAVSAAPSAPTQAQVLERLDDRAPLRRHRVLVIGGGDVAWTARAVRVSDRVIAFLRGHDPIDESIAGVVHVTNDAPALNDVILPDAVVQRVRRALAAPGHPRVVLAGRGGTGRALLVEALAAENKMPSIRVSLAELLADPRALPDRLVACLREAALRGAVCILIGDDVGNEVTPSLAGRIADAIEAAPVPIVFTLPARPAWLVGALHDLVELDVPPPSFRERAALWRAALPGGVAPGDAEIEIVAGRYAFTGGTISRAARRAVSAARLRDPVAPKVTLDDLGDAARLAFSHRLGDVAQRIPAGFSWDDLVLPEDTLAQLREVVSFARERPFLLEGWGFARKLPYGRGVSAILAGPPGTGKTMVAQLLAKELGYDLYRIDLSQVVNKYIGETEKNLARIFTEAEDSHAVLFFDEADALFAKRTDVQTSNDRYANLEVNYLLQRMETYDGVTLLATNLEQGLDEAFKRRVRFAVQFELPDVEEREKLWQSMFPKEVPLAADVNWRALADRFEMAGGYIKKAAVRAALIAATARPRRTVTHADLMEAALREYREMGRVMHGLA